ncbi:MAG: tol-pal system YbgF family protein [Candidatus Krumholzibacteriia bacterium]
MGRAKTLRCVRIAAALSAALCVLSVSRPARGGDKSSPAQTEALNAVGMEFEWARLRPAVDRPSALGNVVLSFDQAVRDVPKHKKSAALFLSGEIRYASGDYREAARQFRKAAGQGKKGPFADDAAFAEILALEAQGRDRDAFKAWKKWRKQYAESPLLPEMLLAVTWNALRRDSLRQASRSFERLESGFPYMMRQPRTVLTGATIAYLRGHADETLALLGKEATGVAAIYLRALAYEARDDMLKAAAQYQEVVDRYPGSRLRDHAMLAKANIFLTSSAYRSAAEEFARVAERAARPEVRAEAELRRAACVFLDGNAKAGTESLRQVASRHAGSEIAARAQLLLGEVLFGQSLYEEAILEFNRVLTRYFQHELAASAQYRVGRCLDALERYNEATTAYKLVVSGYPQAPQAPAAAYLAGVGLLERNRPQYAVPYFQLVLDRYARDTEGSIVFESPDHQELVEASLCLLELSYHRAGNMGQLTGVPHQMLQKLPPSESPWRAWALLIDADALAAQARYEDAQGVLATLIQEFPTHEVGIGANRLLAWTYARQGKDDLAIATEERMLARYAQSGNRRHLSSAYLNKGHILFNRKRYREAAVTYDDFLSRFPEHPQRLLALYQAGLCHSRLDHAGDAVDRWEKLVGIDPAAEIAERAWVRAGDLYFQTEHYEEAKRCYQGLLDNFANSRGAALGMLRMAQCDYNAGRDREALDGFSAVADLYPGTGIAKEAGRGIERALYRLGQGADSGEVLAELVERYPTSAFAADAQFEIAMRRFEGGQFLEAAEAFRRVISQFPSYSAGDRAHFLMADAYGRAGQATDARLAYEQFLMFFPDSELRTTVRFRLGSTRFDEGNYMQAAVDFMTVLEDSTATDVAAAALFNLAMSRRMMGETTEATGLFQRYRKSYPEDERAAQVAYQLGDILDKSGEYFEAAEEYKRALRSKPGTELSVELNYRLGMCREHLGNDERAIHAYREAISSRKRSDAFRLSSLARAAALYEKDGKFKQALAAYKDLIRHAEDPELVLAAKERVSQLKAASR